MDLPASWNTLKCDTCVAFAAVVVPRLIIPSSQIVSMRTFFRQLEGATMFRAGGSRSFKELMFRGALSLICCAIAALCVGGLLSALAENLGPKAPTNDVDRTPCKTINCVLKSKGPRLAHSEKRAFQ